MILPFLPLSLFHNSFVLEFNRSSSPKVKTVREEYQLRCPFCPLNTAGWQNHLRILVGQILWMFTTGSAHSVPANRVTKVIRVGNHHKL